VTLQSYRFAPYRPSKSSPLYVSRGTTILYARIFFSQYTCTIIHRVNIVKYVARRIINIYIYMYIRIYLARGINFYEIVSRPLYAIVDILYMRLDDDRRQNAMCFELGALQYLFNRFEIIDLNFKWNTFENLSRNVFMSD